MSKTNLKRELSGLSKEEIIEVVLSAYSANKETKEYFEFFLNPDAEGLLEKFRQLINREMSRTKSGHRTKARISVIKAHIRKFASFQPGADYVLAIYLDTIKSALWTERAVYFSQTMFNGIKALTTSALEFADTAGHFSEFINTLVELLDKDTGTKYFRKLLKEEVSAFLNR